jgi:hypothetical protein
MIGGLGLFGVGATAIDLVAAEALVKRERVDMHASVLVLGIAGALLAGPAIYAVVTKPEVACTPDE